VIPFRINLQALPEAPGPAAYNQPVLYYSIAFSMSDCNSLAYGWDPIATSCNVNDYIYRLFSCDSSGTCNTGITVHLAGTVCNLLPTPFPLLEDCRGTYTGLPTRYYCYIIGGPSPNQPDQDAFIEWYWRQTSIASEFGPNGKLTWMAPREWINYCWNANGSAYVGGRFPDGIPLFNPSNHNQN
jgi:hypothetical protein